MKKIRATADKELLTWIPQVQDNKRTIRNLAIFTFLVIALGWLGRLLDYLKGSAPGEGVGTLIWIISPLGVSFLLRAFAGDGWRDLGIRPNIIEKLIKAQTIFPETRTYPRLVRLGTPHRFSVL